MRLLDKPIRVLYSDGRKDNKLIFSEKEAQPKTTRKPLSEPKPGSATALKELLWSHRLLVHS